MIQDEYCRKAYVTYVVDGDTFDANVDLGFGIITKQRFRILGIDAPEIITDKGYIAKEYLNELICDKTVVLLSKKKDSFGRFLADVYITERQKEINVGAHLISQGLAEIYN